MAVTKINILRRPKVCGENFKFYKFYFPQIGDTIYAPIYSLPIVFWDKTEPIIIMESFSYNRVYFNGFSKYRFMELFAIPIEKINAKLLLTEKNIY